LDANYGRKDSEAEARVKHVFCEVGVNTYYTQYEAEAYARIEALIDAVPEAKSPCGEAVLHRAIFRTFLEKIYKRTKSIKSNPGSQNLSIRTGFSHHPSLRFLYIRFLASLSDMCLLLMFNETIKTSPC
jgi:hypothetical protein